MKNRDRIVQAITQLKKQVREATNHRPGYEESDAMMERIMRPEVWDTYDQVRTLLGSAESTKRVMSMPCGMVIRTMCREVSLAALNSAITDYNTYVGVISPTAAKENRKNASYAFGTFVIMPFHAMVLRLYDEDKDVCARLTKLFEQFEEGVRDAPEYFSRVGDVFVSKISETSESNRGTLVTYHVQRLRVGLDIAEAIKRNDGNDWIVDVREDGQPKCYSAEEALWQVRAWHESPAGKSMTPGVVRAVRVVYKAAEVSGFSGSLADGWGYPPCYTPKL